ncbi:hypothetical protein [Rhodococcus opacus]|uniref:Uncharacterized protein n=1 Tax=Rhodococcus opacus TaxID=37919 RepID=A0A076EWH1_RHOOP|nr:hypothetical protein [Rhodococcus opacus]AII10340.1 hypothetical protein EP51_39090 [Rhodococcus opacus]
MDIIDGNARAVDVVGGVYGTEDGIVEPVDVLTTSIQCDHQLGSGAPDSHHERCSQRREGRQEA